MPRPGPSAAGEGAAAPEHEREAALPQPASSAAQTLKSARVQLTNQKKVFWPAEGYRDDYLAFAAWLRDDLARIDGFLSVERFQSLAEPTKLLSLSFWRDEHAVTAWRTQGYHREGQVRGRAGLFADYRLRVASVLRDYGLNERAQAPADSKALHDEGGMDW